MATESLQQSLNKQMNNEFLSSHLYLSMAAWCSNKGYYGFARMFRQQSQEEREHGVRLYAFLEKMDIPIVFTSIVLPGGNYNSLTAVCNGALSHEKAMTADIHKIVDMAMKEKKHAVVSAFQWFVDKQVDEECNFRRILARLAEAGDEASQRTLDREIGSLYA